MKRYLKNLGESKTSLDPFLTITHAVGSNSEQATSTSTLTSSTTDPMPSAVASAATASLQVFQAPLVSTAHELQVSPPVSTLATTSVAHLDANSPPNSIIRTNVQPTESGQKKSTQSLFFPSAQNVLITGSTFNYILSTNTRKIPAPQKPNSSPLFTGRKDVLEKLGRIFVHRANGTLALRRTCLLWGMGGIGKTQICLRFIEEMSPSFAHVFWVDASSHDSITTSLKGICSIPAAQASGVDGSVKSALHWISSIQEEWLLVFDNADDPPPEVVAKFMPPGNRGNILVTSRNRSMGRVVSYENSIEIHAMEELDAVTLLLKAGCLDHTAVHLQAAKKIVNELGCIPLAVDHAGAYIEAGKCNINAYLRQFSLHRQTLMSDTAFKGASSYDQTVYGTWDLSFTEIERRASGKSTTGDAQAAKAAILILQICAFYHHSNISRDIFKSAAEKSGKHVVDSEVAEKLPQAMTSLDHTLLALDSDGHWDEFIFGQGTSVLLSFSLMKRGPSSKILSIHPLMHCWSRERMSKSEQQNMYEMGSIILCSAVPETFTTDDYALRRLIFPHINACELHAIQMRFIKEYFDDKYNMFALVMLENGDWKNAEQLYLQAMDMRKKLLGAEHPETLTSMANLADTYRNQGRWNAAEQLEVEVMEMAKKILGVEHPHTIISMGNLAVTYFNQERWDEAEKLEVQVMEIRKKLLGPEHPHTLTSMENLAATYHEQGRWDEAEQLEVQVMEMMKKLLGAEHPHTLTSMGNLAATYHNLGRWDEAEKVEVKVMEMRQKLLGAEHPHTLTSMENLASTYHDQERWDEAEKLKIQVMEMRKKLLGEEHPDTLTSMENMAGMYHDQEKWDEAEALEVQVVEMRKKLLGAHPHTLTNIANLADTYYNQGRLDEAEQLEVEVMEMMKQLHGAEHPDTLTCMENLAATYHDQGRWDEAEKLEVQVMEMRMKLLGAEHPDTLTIMGNLAGTYCKQERWDEAEKLEVQVMEMRMKLHGAEHPDTLAIMGNLAGTYCNQERWDEAEKLEVQVMEMMKKMHGTEHPDTLTSMENLAITYHNQRRFNEAEQLEIQVMEMRKKS